MPIRLTDAERETGEITPERLAVAVRELRDAGVAVVENAYAPEFIADVRAAYDRELDAYLESRGGLDALDGKTFGKNHIGFFPPLFPPLSDPRLAAHPVLVRILTEVLGGYFYSAFYHTNTACPGSGVQPVHRDAPHLFPGFPAAHPTSHVVLNVPFCDFTEENGSTEYWPGSHLVVDQTPDEGRGAALEERAAAMPSVRLNLRAGSFALRDLRAWHRGMPNRADYPRSMLATVFVRSWVAQSPMRVPRSTWEAWPDAARRVYRKSEIVDDADYRPMLWEELR